jgi:DNA-binding NtrC family response regulator
VNFRVPAKAPIGDAVPIVLTVGGSRSTDGVTMAVRPAVQQILAIEPDPAIRTSLRKILTGAGYDVFTASNDRQALAQASQHPIDLVVTNLAMPMEERLATIRKIREQRKLLKLVVTAHALGPRTLRAADLLDAQALLTTPLTSKLAIDCVRELLRSRPPPYERAQESPPLTLTPATPR